MVLTKMTSGRASQENHQCKVFKYNNIGSMLRLFKILYPEQSKLNIYYFMKSQKCKTCDQIYVAIKACARPGQGSTDTKLSSSIVQTYIGDESLRSSKDQTKHSRKSCSSSKAFSCLQPVLHRAFEQKLYYLTFIFLYG